MAEPSVRTIRPAIKNRSKRIGNSIYFFLCLVYSHNSLNISNLLIVSLLLLLYGILFKTKNPLLRTKR